MKNKPLFYPTLTLERPLALPGLVAVFFFFLFSPSTSPLPPLCLVRFKFLHLYFCSNCSNRFLALQSIKMSDEVGSLCALPCPRPLACASCLRTPESPRITGSCPTTQDLPTQLRILVAGVAREEFPPRLRQLVFGTTTNSLIFSSMI